MREEIPKRDWEAFFRDFTRFHQSWIVSVDVFSQAQGAHKAVDERVFDGVVTGQGCDGGVYLEVSIKEARSPQVAHAITALQHVRFEYEGESEILRIDDASDTTVLIICHRAAILTNGSCDA